MRQIRNPGIRFARGATGPYASKLRKRTYARASHKLGLFGVETEGGNNGVVYKVTNLNGGAGGPGSLLACLEAEGPRIAEFEVSGEIDMGYDVYIRNPHLTIAGETAPWPGIAIKNGSLNVAASDVIIQHITIMRGDGVSSDGDTFGIQGERQNPTGETERVIVDHCSFYWGTDEGVGLFSPKIKDVVISNCIIAETLLPTNAGMLLGDGTNVAVVDSLFISTNSRNPGFANGTRTFLGGNVIYNYRNRALQTEPGESTDRLASTLVDNLAIYGPDTVNTQDILYIKSQTAEGSGIYMSGNEHPLGSDWDVVSSDSPYDVRSNAPQIWYRDYVRSEDQKANIIANTGARPWARSDLDQQTINDLVNDTGSIKDCMSGCPNEVGTYPPFQENGP